MSKPTLVEKMESLRHMLGIGSHIRTKKWGYRNYFATSPDCRDHQIMRALESQKLVRSVGKTAHTALVYFEATEDGCKVAGLNARQIKRAMEPT